MKVKKLLTCLLIASLFIGVFSGMTLAGKGDVVSLGADLTKEQRNKILQEFGVKEDEVSIIEVSIEDVKRYLESATSKEIGTQAFSSAHVKLKSEGEGIIVNTNNISLVTKEMYANAMATAGVKDAEIKVTAPFTVTGTTALTGVMMAFEEATGKKLDENAKKVANEELKLTQNISEDLGSDQATELIRKVKAEILGQDIKNPEDIRRVIANIANELGITLSDEQIDQILRLMERISKLDLNVDSILSQLDKLEKNIDIVRDTIEENKGFFQKIIDKVLDWLRSIFG
ncbi:MAG: DUF1002 domain-containing protein [Peptococcaceae bacterium]|nr:DUF1002 domain-containing protein [Peptococcaceae bacterium]